MLDLLRDGELDVARTLNLLDQVSDALDAAHHAGLIHRDVKPQNVLVDEDNQAYLADFGLTRAGSETTVASSRPMMGSVAYVAPEIVRGEEPTPASDRYSLAATLFHCLTGEVPFPLGSDAAILFAHATEPPPRAHERREDLPSELDDVLQIALAKQPDVRPRTARAILGATREALGPAVDELGPPAFGRSVERPSESIPIPTTKSRRSSKVVVGAVALLAAGALGASAAIWLDGDSGTAASTPEVPVPPVPAGATALGSDLPLPERSLDCRGKAPSAASQACSIVQSELPGAPLLAPADGLIVGWGVRGADGELALDVIRPRGTDTLRVARSQFEVASNAGPSYFPARIQVEAGDQIGVQLGTGATIGVSDTEGATTQRWRNPLGGAYGSPDLAAGTGFDYEVALRADFVPGGQVKLPPFITDGKAARAPEAEVRESAVVELEDPSPVRLRIELAELKNRVVLDVFNGDRRTVRVFIPGLLPHGVPIGLEAGPYPDEPTAGVGVWWTNPNSGRAIYRDFAVTEGNLVYAL
jgi:hypothetical protein